MASFENYWIIHNARLIPVIPRNKIWKDAGIIIDNGIIVDIDDSTKIKLKAGNGHGYERLDVNGALVLPAFINAHTHLPETLLRGVCDDEPLDKWLWDYIWPIEAKLKPRDAYIGTKLGLIELIRNGVCGFIDQFYYAHEIATAVAESGLRALLCPSVFDNNPEAGSIENCYRRAQAVITEWMGKNPRIFWGIGPHATYTVDHELLTRICEFARERKLPVHIHMAESKWEIQKVKDLTDGKSPFQYLAEFDLLKDLKLLAAHCVHVSSADIKLMHQHNIHVLHNPTSNLKLASGIAPITQFLAQGINVCIGTDGCASNNNLDMIEEVRLTALLQKNLTGDPRSIPLSTALELITINGAYAFGLESNIGSIEIGKEADLIVISLDNAQMRPNHNLLSNLIYASSSSDITHLFVAGNLIMADRKILTIDEAKVYAELESIIERLKQPT